MAEQSNILGLFGLTPELYQQQQQQQLIKQQQDIASQYAQPGTMMNPSLAPLYAAATQQGQQIGQAGKMLFGVEDPQLKMVRDISMLKGQFDLSTPSGMRQFAKALSDKGYGDLAVQASARAADIDKEIAQAEKARFEKIPEVVQLQSYRDRLAQQFGSNDPRVVELTKVIEGKAKAGQTNIDLGGLSQLFAKTEAQSSAKAITEQIDKAQQALSTNSKVSRDIAEIEKILPNTFTGQFANFNKTASKTLSAMGIPVSDKASNTEVLQALTNNLVLPAIKQLPGSLAAKELAFLQQTKPEALQEPATIKRLIGLIKDDISVNRALVKRADSYQKQDKYNSLQGFNIALQQDSIYSDLRKYNALKDKVNSGQKITQEEADFAKATEKELGL